MKAPQDTALGCVGHAALARTTFCGPRALTWGSGPGSPPKSRWIRQCAEADAHPARRLPSHRARRSIPPCAATLAGQPSARCQCLAVLCDVCGAMVSAAMGGACGEQTAPRAEFRAEFMATPEESASAVATVTECQSASVGAAAPLPKRSAMRLTRSPGPPS